MTAWHLFAGYSLVGVGYILLSSAVRIIGSTSRPPIDGHLDVRVKLGPFEWWYVLSVILITPWVIAYSGEKPSYRSDSVELSVGVLYMYFFIALVWIIKLQRQLNAIVDRKDS